MAKYESEFPIFSVTVDLVVLTIRDGVFSVLLVRRGEKPYAGRLALPGGFTQEREDIEDAAYRELSEEAGLGRGDVHLEQLQTFGAPRRDPRSRVVSVGWLALGADLPNPVPGSDAAGAMFMSVEEALADAQSLAFDHAEIIRVGVERARSKLEYMGAGAAFCPREFTVGELRTVYEAVWGVNLDPANFHRKVTKTEGFLEPTGETTGRGGGRPAQLFRGRADARLNPPILRD